MVLLGNINLRQAGSSAEAAEYSSGSLLCPAVASPARRLLDRGRFSNGFSLSFFLCGIFLLFILSLSLSRAGEFYLFLLLFLLPFYFWIFVFFALFLFMYIWSSSGIIRCHHRHGNEAHWSNSAVSVFMAIFIFIFTILLSFFFTGQQLPSCIFYFGKLEQQF